MKQILLSALVTGAALIALGTFAFTRPVLPMKSTQIGTLVFEASEPISDDARIDSAALREASSKLFPKSRRVDYKQSLEHLEIIYDDSVRRQFFIRYSYGTYEDSGWKLFFDASLHNRLIELALNDAIFEAVAKYDAKIGTAQQAADGDADPSP